MISFATNLVLHHLPAGEYHAPHAPVRLDFVYSVLHANKAHMLRHRVEWPRVFTTVRVNLSLCCLAVAQQHVTDTEMQAVRAVRASNETRSCPAHNGVAMGVQWVVREPR